MGGGGGRGREFCVDGRDSLDFVFREDWRESEKTCARRATSELNYLCIILSKLLCFLNKAFLINIKHLY